MLIVGEKEVAGGSVSVRVRSGEDLGPIPVTSVIEMIREKVGAKA